MLRPFPRSVLSSPVSGQEVLSPFSYEEPPKTKKGELTSSTTHPASFRAVCVQRRQTSLESLLFNWFLGGSPRLACSRHSINVYPGSSRWKPELLRSSLGSTSPLKTLVQGTGQSGVLLPPEAGGKGQPAWHCLSPSSLTSRPPLGWPLLCLRLWIRPSEGDKG